MFQTSSVITGHQPPPAMGCHIGAQCGANEEQPHVGSQPAQTVSRVMSLPIPNVIGRHKYVEYY